MAAPALRAVRRLRLEAFLLPRISVTPVRAINGGEGSSQTGICKTLVSFPVKFSNFQDSTTGENINQPGTGPETLKPLRAPPPDEGSVSGQSEGDAQLGDEVSQQKIQSVDKELPQEEDSSSSSSDSESEEEEDHTPRHGKKRDGDGTSLQTFYPSQNRTHGESPTTQEHNEILVQKQHRSESDRSEDLVDTAPSVATEEQLTVVGAQRRGGGERSEDDQNLPGGPSSTDDIQSGATQILFSGICEEPTKGVDKEPAISRSDGSEDLVDTAPPVATEEHLTLEGAQSLGGGEREKSGDDENLPCGPSSTDDIPLDASQILSSGVCEEPTEGIDQEPAVSLSPPGPLAAPVPEEPFDNSKYQNEQHFSYTPFTFVDYDVELAKFRLPQPSSGRPSPQH